jgi:hypothetical protein
LLIYIGEDVVVKGKDIVAIFDKDVLSSSAENLSSISLPKNIDLNHIKSFVVTNDTVYSSPFASQTLKKRLYTFIKK